VDASGPQQDEPVTDRSDTSPPAVHVDLAQEAIAQGQVAADQLLDPFGHDSDPVVAAFADQTKGLLLAECAGVHLGVVVGQAALIVEQQLLADDLQLRVDDRLAGHHALTKQFVDHFGRLLTGRQRTMCRRCPPRRPPGAAGKRSVRATVAACACSRPPDRARAGWAARGSGPDARSRGLGTASRARRSRCCQMRRMPARNRGLERFLADWERSQQAGG
jgi:hypothetical protein